MDFGSLDRGIELKGPNGIVVQPGRDRYVAVAEQAVMIRIVLSEYLACEVIWQARDTGGACSVNQEFPARIA